MDSTLFLVSATGNRFALFDGFAGADGPRLRDPSALAQDLGRRGELGLDGLLQLLPARDDGDCRMVLHNMDGSRAAACGNGLRCIAMRMLRQGYHERDSVLIETDAGTRQVEISANGGPVRARASMGPVRVLEPAVRLSLDVAPGEVEVAVVDAGNPHCVLFVEDAKQAAVEVIGPALETHEHFPDRANVGFVETHEPGLRLRVWERGVGETRSCGTGATAAAAVAVQQGRATYPLRVEMAGGILVVLQERGELFLEGDVEFESGRFLSIPSTWLAEPKPGRGGSGPAPDAAPDASSDPSSNRARELDTGQ